MRTLVAIAIVAGLAGRAAASPICVVLDESRDMLDDDERHAAEISFIEALARHGVELAGAECPAAVRISHVRLGRTLTLYVDGPSGHTSRRVSRLDDLPLIYDQLAQTIAAGESLDDSERHIDRANVTSEQALPQRRAITEGIVFVRLGYGATFGREGGGGTAFGIGGRLELDHAAIELTVLDGVVPSGHARSAGDFVRLAGLWYGSPRANSSAFGGIGVGYGWSSGANGFDATITAGYEMLRATTVRALLQLDVTLPTYSGNEWSPSVALSFGLGLGTRR